MSSTKATYGLLGRNISYSLSPVMHNAAFQHFGIDAEYVLFDKEEDEVEPFLKDEILTGNISGINVTVPYKIMVYKILSRDYVCKDEITKALETINTVDVGSKTLRNTDIKGFYESLKEDLGFESTEDKKVFMAGAGGAGRALGFFLATLSKELHICDIDKGALDSLSQACDKFLNVKINTVKSEDETRKIIPDCDLVVNATPLGTKDGDERSAIPIECLAEGMAVYDLVYARETALIKRAKDMGLNYANGLGMLINQAALSFEMWTDKPFDDVKTVMKKAALEELAKE